MSREAKALRQRIIEMVDIQLRNQGYWHDDWKDKLLKVKVEIHENWWNKNNTVKKKDIANREKFLIDSIFQGLGLDDRFIWEHQLLKVDDEEFYSVITIEPYRKVA